MPTRLPHCVLIIAALLLALAPRIAAADEPFPGKKSDFHGYAQYDFPVDGVPARVVVPKETASGKPWIWRARFWGHRPEVDIALLGKGWHVAYIDVANLFGSPAALKRWDALYKLLTEQHGFAHKPALEGMSRGGLIIFNWAEANPDKVACIYADAPVCDIKSWPAGFGKGKGHAPTWETCKKAYGFASDDEAKAFRGNPIDNLKPLADAKVPLLHVSGDADDVVPLDENTRIIESRYKALGGSIQVIVKPGIGHKHGLDDPAPIIDFVLKHATPQ